MLGEQCQGIELETRGVSGDRLFAVRDTDGKFGSGKNSRRFRQIDGLFAFQASDSAGSLNITFPDGSVMRGDDPLIHTALSDVLGVAVTLVREEQVSHFDQGPIHLVSTAALAWLAERLPDSRIDERRFRVNIVVATTAEEESEHSWVNGIVRIGDTVRLKVTAPTERCRMITLAQGDMPDDPKILRCVAQEAGLQFGVYADVLTGGRIDVGEKVAIERGSVRNIG